MTSVPAIDMAHCPLCGEANRCAVALARERGSAQEDECWCMQADFSLAPLDRLPADARGRACLCARCAAAPQAVRADPCGSRTS